MKFENGDRVVLATRYWVNRQGDCDRDTNVTRLVVGKAVGTVHGPEYVGHDDIVLVTWDDDEHERKLRVNATCLKLEKPLTNEEIEEAIASIQKSWPGVEET